MTNEIMNFEFDGNNVRTMQINGEAWFVGKDVATVLGYARTADAVRKHVDEEDRGVSNLATPSGEQSMTIINESGLYSLIISSKLPAAKNFKDFEEGTDFTGVPEGTPVKGGNGNVQYLDDYAVTLDMAKELCMMSKTAKGKEIRTQKGRKFIYDVLKENGTLPLIERDDIA